MKIVIIIQSITAAIFAFAWLNTYCELQEKIIEIKGLKKGSSK